MTYVTDLNSKELELYSRLNEVQLNKYYEPSPGLFIAESEKVVERALQAGYQAHSFLVETTHKDRIAPLASQCGDVPLYYADLDVLTSITGYNLTGGVLCAMYRKPVTPARDILLDPGVKRIAVLEGVVNPTNVGAIFRSAAALNMDAVFLAGGCSDPLYRRAIRVSMGTVFQVPWGCLDADVNWSENGVDYLHRFGFKTAAMALKEDSVGIDDAALNSEGKLAVILGAEGDGLKPETIASCDYTVMIPMSHGVDSLNVAAASAVAFYQLGNK